MKIAVALVLMAVLAVVVVEDAQRWWALVQRVQRRRRWRRSPLPIPLRRAWTAQEHLMILGGETLWREK